MNADRTQIIGNKMVLKKIIITTIFLLASSLIAAERATYIFDPHLLIEKPSEDRAKIEPYLEQPSFNIYHDGNLIMINVPKALMHHYNLMKQSAIKNNEQLRCKINPLNLVFNNTQIFANYFFTLTISEINDTFTTTEIRLEKAGIFNNTYQVCLPGYDEPIIIDKKIYDRLTNLKITAAKKNCSILINLGFINPIVQHYSERDLKANIKLDTPESLNSSTLESSRTDPEIPAPKCLICQDPGADLLLLPCAHLCSHEACWKKEQHCPICKGAIEQVKKVYY